MLTTLILHTHTHTPGRSASSINLFVDDSLLFSLIKIWVTVIASLWDNCDCLTVKLLIRLSHEVKVETNDHNHQNRAMKSSNVPFTWNLPMQEVMLISKINMQLLWLHSDKFGITFGGSLQQTCAGCPGSPELQYMVIKSACNAIHTVQPAQEAEIPAENLQSRS